MSTIYFKESNIKFSNPMIVLVIGIMIVCVSYQAILCFINTNIFTTSRAIVGLAELLILLSCLPLLQHRLSIGPLLLILISGAMFSLLLLIDSRADIKAFRDLLIPLWFFMLGKNIGREDIADKCLAFVIVFVGFFAFFELFFLDIYTSLLNIEKYYISIGSLTPTVDFVRETNLQLNGMRPEGIGRTFFPDLIGRHRVSSVFLEPVSFGNFATMIAAWGLSKPHSQLKWQIFFISSALLFIVLADSRFSLLTIPLLVFVRYALQGNQFKIFSALPIFAVFLLVTLAAIFQHYDGDDYLGRLVVSGSSLREFGIGNILGLPGSRYYGDHGYAYALSSYGLPLCVLLWGSFWLLSLPDATGERFRAFVAIYICFLLCISGNSLFALKSSALLWFLVGTTLKQSAYSHTLKNDHSVIAV